MYQQLFVHDTIFLLILFSRFGGNVSNTQKEKTCNYSSSKCAGVVFANSDCGNQYNYNLMLDENFKYCPNCGGRINWNDS